MNKNTPALPLSLYIHIPWCLKKCPYCDFNSHAVRGSVPEARYIDALLMDLALDIKRFYIERAVQSIFIGGGTPSLFAPESLNRLLRGIEQQISLANDIEITLEANPGTFELQKFQEFKALGINRLSIGVQSFDDKLLEKIGRVHSGMEATAACERAHKIGFDNINLDLMFGLPGASIEHSEKDILRAISLSPSHISFYQLTLEANTYFHQFPPKLPDDEQVSGSLLQGQALLVAQHYQQYEVSAYSLAGHECRHNLNYWRFGDYLGIGAGAHGKISQKLPDSIIRYHKIKSPALYLEAADKIQGAANIATADLPVEFMMNHLRLKQGFDLETYQRTTGLNCDSLEPALSASLNKQLLIEHDGNYRCSEKGWNFLDCVIEAFLA